MSAGQVKAALDRAIEAWNAGDLDGYLELYAEDVVLHGYPPEMPPNLAGVTGFYRQVWSAFPGGTLTIHDRIVEDDRAALRYTLRGAHEGAFMGAPPTGREVVIEGQTILHFRDGRCVARWQALDQVGLLIQLGLMPPPV